jgi:hypothetical protein
MILKWLLFENSKNVWVGASGAQFKVIKGPVSGAQFKAIKSKKNVTLIVKSSPRSSIPVSWALHVESVSPAV